MRIARSSIRIIKILVCAIKNIILSNRANVVARCTTENSNDVARSSASILDLAERGGINRYRL